MVMLHTSASDDVVMIAMLTGSCGDSLIITVVNIRKKGGTDGVIMPNFVRFPRRNNMVSLLIPYLL